MHIASEESKQGFSDEEVMDFLAGIEQARQSGDNEKYPFAHLNSVFDRIKALDYPFLGQFDLKSFGMTHDYHIAVEMGSNMVRVGTKIFGPRGVRLS